jgi:hypothetical protein
VVMGDLGVDDADGDAAQQRQPGAVRAAGHDRELRGARAGADAEQEPGPAAAARQDAPGLTTRPWVYSPR